MKTRVPRDQVRVFAGDRAPGGSAASGTARRPEKSASEVYLQTSVNTLDLRGMYVDDALPEVDAFLDRMALAQAPPGFLIQRDGTRGPRTAAGRRPEPPPRLISRLRNVSHASRARDGSARRSYPVRASARIPSIIPSTPDD